MHKRNVSKCYYRTVIKIDLENSEYFEKLKCLFFRFNCILTFAGVSECHRKQAEAVQKNMGKDRSDMEKLVGFLKNLEKHHKQDNETDYDGDEDDMEMKWLPRDPKEYYEKMMDKAMGKSSLPPSRCLSVCLSVSLCLSVCLSVCLPVCLFVCVSGWLAVWLAGCLSVCLCISCVSLSVIKSS